MQLFLNQADNQMIFSPESDGKFLTDVPVSFVNPIGGLFLSFVNLDFGGILKNAERSLSIDSPENEKRFNDVLEMVKGFCLALEHHHIYLSQPTYKDHLNRVKSRKQNRLGTDESLAQQDISNLKGFISSKKIQLESLKFDFDFYRNAIEFCYFGGHEQISPEKLFYIFAQYSNFDFPALSISYVYNSKGNLPKSEKEESNLENLVDRMHDEEVILSEACIGSTEDLLYYELVKLLTSGALISKCKNCNDYFLINGRSNTVYCDNCKESGPQKVYREKVDKDPILKLYNRAYKRYHQQVLRKTMEQSEFLAWTIEAKSMCKKAQDGEISFEEFKAWIEK